MKRARKFQVSIIGSSNATKVENDLSYDLGCFIGGKGWVLINGGRTGVMEASSRGCYDANGISVAILPFDSIDAVNIYSTISIATTIGYARNCITVASADVVVVVGGKSGTLCELTYAWQYNKPIICCSWIDGVSKNFAGICIDDKRVEPTIRAENIDEVYSLLNNFYKNFIKLNN
ncbi:MAG: TIGR00725 family protein [Exilispira sp.]